MIEFVKINKRFNRNSVDEIQLFEDFSLKIQPGEFVSIIGSNGSGKSSLLNIACGTVFVDSGTVLLNDEDVTRKAEEQRYRRIGRVFQDPALGTSPTLTLAQNLALAERKAGRFDLSRGLNKSRYAAYREMLKPLGLGLEEKLETKVESLSGGQRQAVALLMSTMTPIDLLILDEHTAALDPKTADLIMKLTAQIVREKALTALMVTHNLRFAVEYGDRLLMMHEGQVIMDISGEKKQATQVDDLLDKFYEISIEYGNSV